MGVFLVAPLADDFGAAAREPPETLLMVQSKAQTVEAYIRQASQDRAEILKRIRDMARSLLSDHEERMHWGMPVYSRSGALSFGFAAQKQFISLYFINPAVLRENAQAVANLEVGKTCVRLRKSTAIDWALLEKLLVDARDLPAGALRHERASGQARGAGRPGAAARPADRPAVRRRFQPHRQGHRAARDLRRRGADRGRLGRQRPGASLLRHLAAHHEHDQQHHHLPDGVPDPEQPGARQRGHAGQAGRDDRRAGSGADNRYLQIERLPDKDIERIRARYGPKPPREVAGKAE